MVAYLTKSEGSEGFHEIIDFLSGSHIHYALTENPTIYVSLIENFWQTAALSTDEDGNQAITATIDGHFSPQWKFFIRTILHCMSSKKTAWDQFSSDLATAIICLATNRIFNFSRYIFDAMVNNLDNNHKFLMYPSQPQSEPSTSPSRISFSPSLPSHHTTSTPPSTQHIHEVEEPIIMPHDSPLLRGHTPRSDKGSMQPELTILVTNLTNRVDASEKDLQLTKKTYNITFTKLVLMVKKLENQIKSGKARRRARIVVSDDEDEVHEEVQEKTSADTEVLIQEETPIEIIEDLGSAKKEISTANILVSTASPPKDSTAEVGTASHDISAAATALAYIRGSASKAKDKGKAIVKESEPLKKLKKREQVQISVD
ncbi:hypothetical protein Tco_0459536 [Tanacetum coccineum]